MGFQCEKAVVGGFDVVRPESQFGKELIGGAIKQHAVIGHVEVAVVVNPLVLDGHGGGDVGGGLGHGGLDYSC